MLGPFLQLRSLRRLVFWIATIGLLAGSFAASAWADRRVALVLGNSNYKSVPALLNPINDARDVTEKLTKLGFEVITGTDVDVAGWRSILQQFERKAAKADAALFFFAGHAMQFQGQNYLMPINAVLNDETSLTYDMISIKEIRDAFDRARVGVRIVVLDACRNNALADTFHRNVTGPTRSTTSPTRGLARVDKADGMLFVYATASDSVAEDGKHTRNSPFTTAFLSRLDEPGVEVGTLFRRVRGDVIAKTNHKQQPELHIALSQDFYLNTQETDAQAWGRFRDRDDPDALRQFLQKYPQSIHVPDATFRLNVAEKLRRVASLEQELNDRRASTKNNDALERELQEKKNELDALRASTKNSQEIANELLKKEKELNELREKSRNSDELERELQNKKSELDALRASAKNSEAIAHELLKKEKELSEIRGKARNSDELERELQNKKSELDALRASAKNSEAIAHELLKKEKELSEIRGKVRNSEELAKELMQKQKELDDLRQQVVASASQSRGLRVEGGDRQLVEVPDDPANKVSPGSGEIFRDKLADGSRCEHCPAMAVLPSGEFLMGSSEDDIAAAAKEWPTQTGWFRWETPQHKVKIERKFAITRTNITRGEFATFARDTGFNPANGCHFWDGKQWKADATFNWRSPGFKQEDNHPVVCVSWTDAWAFARWLSKGTAYDYRLLSEAEAEFAIRGTTVSEPMPRYSFGNDLRQLCLHANNQDETYEQTMKLRGKFYCKDGYVHTAPVGSFKKNNFGLFDVHGNAWTWTQDCFTDNYTNAPTDGSARLTSGDCNSRVLRGGSWDFAAGALRSAIRAKSPLDNRYSSVGFRLARLVGYREITSDSVRK